MEPRFMNYPSPRGVHVPETYASDDYDPYRPPRRNRYSRSARQTPRIRDATWVSSPEPTLQTSHPPSPWVAPPQAPSSSYRPASAAAPSPAPTVGEHMALDESDFEIVDHYLPQRKRGGLFKSFWGGLKRLTGHQYRPSRHSSRQSSYHSQTMEMPAPLSAGSEGTQYVDPSPTDEQPGVTPYGSPYAHPNQLGSVVPDSGRASPVPSVKMPSQHGSPVPSVVFPHARKPSATPVMPPSALRSPSPVPPTDIVPPIRVVSPSVPPYARSFSATPAVLPSALHAFSPAPSEGTAPSIPQYLRRPSATPAVLPSALRAPSPTPSVGSAPPIRVVSPSIPPSPRQSVRRSTRAATPAIPILRSPPGGEEPGLAPAQAADEGSQTLHEPVLPRVNTQLVPGPVAVVAHRAPEPASPDGSLASTAARVRRFLAGLDKLPWVSEAQIADEYVPANNPRSLLRRQMKQGAEPSWYNPPAEVAERPAYLSEWDMWATQAAAGLWDGKGTVVRPEWGAMYPRGYGGFIGPNTR